MKTALHMKTAGHTGKLQGVGAFVRYGIVFLLAALAANARMIGGLAGMGVALSAALPRSYSFAAIAGSAAGYFLFGMGTDQLVLFPALAILFAVKFFFPRLSGQAVNPLGIAAVSCVIMLVCGFGASVVEQAGVYVNFIRILQAFLCFAVTYFCAVAVRAFFSSRDLRHYTVREYVSIGVVAGVFLLALCGIQFFTFSLGRIAGMLAILCFVSHGGFSSAAVAAGVSAAFILYSPDYAPYCGALMTAAILASALKPLQKLGQVAVFLAVNTACAFLITTGQPTVEYLLDVLFASAVFAVIPSRLLGSEFSAFVLDEDKTERGDGGWIQNRLRFAALAVKDMKQSVDLVSEKLQENSVPDISSVYHRSADRVCRNCGLKMFCWESQYDTTWEALETITPTLKKESRIREDQMPAYFQNKCCKFSAFTAEINQNYQSYLSHRQAVRMVEEARQVSSEQLDGMAQMLCEIGSEIGTVSLIDHAAGAKVRSVLRNLNFSYDEVNCLTDLNGRMCVEIYTNASLNVSQQILCETISSALDLDFDLPSVTEIGTSTRLSFFEMARYHADFYAEQYPADGESYCGDSYETFLDSKGYFHIVLSDGMGSGGHAAIDSTMTCSFVLKLVKAGFGFESAIKLINSSLLVKAADESLATIDIVRLDLYTGKAEFLKAGAAPSFLLKSDSVQKLETDSLPAGILKGIGFDRAEHRLSSGDLVLMVSDGVTATGTDWIEAELELNANKSCKEIAQRIVKEARRRRIDGHSDDVTVAVIRLDSAG